MPIKRHPKDISTPEEKIDTPAGFKIMAKQTQISYTHTSTYDNQPDTVNKRVNREGQ